MIAYRIKDFDIVEKCILNYIEKCHKADNWFPVLYYYISKNNKSELYTDIENFDGEETESDNFNGETYI